MAEYNINKGIGQSVEFKGLKAQYLFIFAGGLHRYGCRVCLRPGLADLRPQPTLRGARADEANGQQTASPIPDQPTQTIPDYQKQV